MGESQSICNCLRCILEVKTFSFLKLELHRILRRIKVCVCVYYILYIFIHRLYLRLPLSAVVFLMYMCFTMCFVYYILWCGLPYYENIVLSSYVLNPRCPASRSFSLLFLNFFPSLFSFELNVCCLHTKPLDQQCMTKHYRVSPGTVASFDDAFNSRGVLADACWGGALLR